MRSYPDSGPTIVSSDLLETEPRRIGVRSLDALHLAGAPGIDAPVIATYDLGPAEAARAHGLKAVAPE
ncbi:hypothetical protein GII33_04955 [Gordonia pseudamarae]|uniref:Uncharacterized protein n=1 Tax=Gordonia pseudamarae TaxID=2831662 RepID=A0ABX6IET0_9ACTN|nr:MULTISPECIES: hypothetical protein [Gordonia]MBD0023593.1 hypothetical protein [Gordonia sp. (in: high G+C Gram-positive bacteria)]QHN25412.1 hypothetical protein GII33_04955 [Gordonia pseudamarae]QHN34344.1 hypothetical protein GII31_04950 [Gordonia pseudamarae]